jgi:hypothetical protein
LRGIKIRRDIYPIGEKFSEAEMLEAEHMVPRIAELDKL